MPASPFSSGLRVPDTSHLLVVVIVAIITHHILSLSAVGICRLPAQRSPPAPPRTATVGDFFTAGRLLVQVYAESADSIAL
jgi:hypothetical protein